MRVAFEHTPIDPPMELRDVAPGRVFGFDQTNSDFFIRTDSEGRPCVAMFDGRLMTPDVCNLDAIVEVFDEEVVFEHDSQRLAKLGDVEAGSVLWMNTLEAFIKTDDDEWPLVSLRDGSLRGCEDVPASTNVVVLDAVLRVKRRLKRSS